MKTYEWRMSSKIATAFALPQMYSQRWLAFILVITNEKLNDDRVHN